MLAVAGVAAACAVPAQASLVHRYSFSEQPGLLTVRDSVGTADGVIKGNGADFDGAGLLRLPGGTTSGADPSTIAGYVDLPNHIINVLTSLTIETWVTWEGSGAWQRVFDLGTSAGGEDIVNGGGSYLFLSPQGDANLRFAVRDPVTGTEPTQLTAGARLDTFTPICLTVTYDPASNVSCLYSNAVLLVTGPAGIALKDINDVNNWLGRSQWNDSMFAGTYDEFRIYNNALNPVEVAASYVAGTENPSTDPASLGALQSVTLHVLKTTLTQQDTQGSTVSADYANFAGIPLAGVPGVVFASDAPLVLKIDQSGNMEALEAGTATISATYGGKKSSVLMTVNARQTGPAVAGKLWVDLRAEDVKSDTTVWPNRAGTGAADDFYAVGSPVYEANVAGTGVAGVKFAGTEAYLGPNSTSDLDGGSDRSIEVWAYNPSLADEETMIAWGHRGGPDRSNMSFNYGANATWGAVGHWGADVGWSGNPQPGQWHYLVYTYDGAQTARVYADAQLKTTKALGASLDTYAAFPIRLGAQANNTGSDFDFGQALSGDIAFVRVHGGQLSAADIANNYLFGPTLSSPGALQSIDLVLSQALLPGVRYFGTVQVKANFENRQGLDVLAFSTLESSDPTVVSVDATGTYTALKPGTATLTATYKAKQSSKLVTVGTPPATALKHRYSFSEAAGVTTVKDSVGTADGTVKGTGADFTGSGQLVLPGGGSSADADDVIAGYVDLPNGIISPLVNLTFETWVTWNASASSWQRVFDFGTSAGGENVANGNGDYFFMSPQGDANLRFAVRDPRTGGEPTQLTSSAPLAMGTEVHLAATYDYTGNQARLYSNAVLVASGPAGVPPNIVHDVNNWLGRSQWGDPMFNGSYNEFRIWEGALTADQVAADYAAGPDKLPVTSGPTLVVSVSGSNVVIAWPADAAGVTLQSSPVVGPTAVWSTVDTSGAVVENGQKKLTVTPSAQSQYYRTRQ